MRVLGIESSCDETAVSIYDTKEGLLSEVLFSQITLHGQYGGVVPELASRDHLLKISSLVEEALKNASLQKTSLDGVAYTKGPGLSGALLVGASFAKSFAYALGLPSIGVHHLRAHLLASQLASSAPSFPFLGLLVSGGHTALISVANPFSYQLLGDTLDDAVGEAFDKTAKLMGIPYPGGAHLAGLADQSHLDTSELKPFPRPMIRQGGGDFSFSGLKTHALMAWERSKKDDASRAEIATLFQEAVIETLVAKSEWALKETGFKTLVVAGGVAANRALRAALKKQFEPQDISVFWPEPRHCTDNAAMIALTGALYLEAGYQDKGWEIEVKPRWSIEG